MDRDPTRPVLLLVVGTRGTLLADTCTALLRVADVVVVSSADLLAARADADAALPAGVAPIVAPTADGVRAAVAHRARGLDRRRGRLGVLTFSDDVVELTARIAADLGVPGQPPETTPRFRDKAVQRRALAAAGLPVPRHAEITAPAGAAAAAAAVGLPAILKPARGSGGAMAAVVASVGELTGLLERGFAAAAAGGAGGAVDRATTFVLEELLVGVPTHPVPGFAPYVSVESATLDGRTVHLAVTDRFPLAPPVLETGMVLPSALAAPDRDAVLAATSAALAALGTEHALTHTELMLTAEGPVVIEVNARAGGALPYLFPLAGGPDLTELAGRLALGEAPGGPVAFPRHAVFTAPQHPIGVEVVEVTGLDAARDAPGVRVVIPLAAAAGTSTRDEQHTMIAVVLGTAADPAAAVAQHRAVRAAVRARYHPAVLPDHHLRTPDGVLAAQPAPDPVTTST